MKTIKRQEEIAFNAISFKEAIVLLPLMDALTQAANHNRVAEFYNSLNSEEKKQYRRVWHRGDINLQPDAAEKILKVLTDLGFESQIDLKDASFADLESANKDN
jgi:hypothetical protein